MLGPICYRAFVHTLMQSPDQEVPDLWNHVTMHVILHLFIYRGANSEKSEPMNNYVTLEKLQ